METSSETEEFFSNFVSSVRSPMIKILGYHELIRKEITETPHKKQSILLEYLDEIRAGIYILEESINDFQIALDTSNYKLDSKD